ncbi:hypothetical protein IMSAG049_00742 [Clostridiales bacterium]|nr:hypothetical protein IMSAG049_00742 [Clostridiales bacterium]
MITTETVTTTTTESSIEVDVPEEGTTENEDGSITTIKVTTDENGKVTGYTEVTEVLNEEGVVVSSTTKTVSRSGSSKTTTVTTTVKTQTVAPDAKTDINVSMGEITEGKNHGKLDLNGIEVVDVPDNFNDLLEPGESDSNINLDDIPDDSMVFVDGIGLMSKYNITIMIAKNPSFIGQTKYTVGWPVQQYIVKDKDGNSHVVYCADMSVPAEDGNEYYLENAEDADYYTNPNTNKKDPDGSWHIRDIATNGYWGTAAGEMGSLSVMIDNLLAAKEAGNEFLQNVTEEDIKALTEGQALAATQAAIWKYGNSMNNNPFVLKGGDLMEAATENSKLEYDPVTGIITRTTTTVDKETGKIITKTEHKEVHLPTGVDVEIERDPVTGEITMIHVPQYSSAYIKLLPDGWLNNPIHSLVGGKDHHKDDPDVQMIEAVYKWLTNMEKQEDTTTDLIKPSDIVEAVTNVKEQVGKDDQGRDVYEADVSFVLTVEPNRLNGDLMVNVYDSETGEIIATRRIAGDGSNDDPSIKQAGSIHNDKGIVYTIDGLQLANGQQIRINLVGSQEVKKGAYLITAKTGADTSQTFIGIEEGSRDVNLDFTLKLDVNPGVVNTVENSEVVENTEWTEESKVEYSYWEIELPENPTPGPEPDPETPTTPTTSDPDPDPDPEIPEEPEVEIPEEPTPMVETPEEFEEEPEDDIEIFDEDVPLSDIPEIDIPENDIPLSDVPQTGDTFNMMLWVSLMLIAAFGMCIIFVTGKGKKGNF